MIINHKGIKRFILLIFFFVFSFGQGLPNSMALTIEEEQELGRHMLSQIQNYFEMEEDSFVNDYINDLGSFLVQSLENRPFDFNFYVIRSNQVNAFATAGGHIFVFSGLIEMVDSVDELASVLCHEIGHVTARHISRRIEKGKKMNLAIMAGVLAGMMIGGEAAAPIVIGSTAAGMQTQLNYTREDERQADQLGFKYMDMAGLNPASSISVNEKLRQNNLIGTNMPPPYLLTHPLEAERMANINAMLNDYQPKKSGGMAHRFEEEFPFFKTIVWAVSAEPRIAEQKFSARLADRPDSYVDHLGLGIVLKAKAEYPAAIEHLQMALPGVPDSVAVKRYLAELYLLMGKDQEGIGLLKEILEENSKDIAAMSILAKGYLDLEQYSEAISLFRKLTYIKPVKDDVFYNLGVAYGRQDLLGPAHYNFGIYFQKTGDPAKAEFHFNKAYEYAGGDLELKALIDKASQHRIRGK
jgi:predicted Zn-dependent protease